ncbi:MAG: hypothetical protein AB7S38_31260 [Vulcanimicrobiota bacterium]
MQHLNFDQFRLGVTQVLGSVRLAPVLRQDCPGDLRLGPVGVSEERVASADGKANYLSYFPHALIARFSQDGSALVPQGTQLGQPSRLCSLGRVYRRTGPGEVAFLPLHVAMEGFLSLHFKGPEIAWPEYVRQVRRRGLGFRLETSASGWVVKGLERALACFEWHPHQVGSLLFVDDEFLAAFVVSHPQDYRKLHRSLLTDFFPEQVLHYGYLRAAEDRVSFGPAKNLDELRRELERQRSQHHQLNSLRAESLVNRPVQAHQVYKLGPFRLQRFCTDLARGVDNHIGEAILRADGKLEYLKSYRLSEAQSRRAFLLRSLAEADWNLGRAAESLHCVDEEEVARLLIHAGFGYLLNPELVRRAR